MRKPQHAPEERAHQQDAGDKNRDVRDAARLRGDDRRADRARPGEKRHGERHDAGISACLELARFGLGLAHLAHLRVEHGERHQQKHQPAADLERRQAGADEAQHMLAEHRRAGEDGEHRDRDHLRESQPRARPMPGGNADEDRDCEERIQHRGERNRESQVFLPGRHFLVSAACAALRSSFTLRNAGRSPSIFRYGLSCGRSSSTSRPRPSLHASDTSGRCTNAAQSASVSSGPAIYGSNLASSFSARTPFARSLCTACRVSSDTGPRLKNTSPYNLRATSSKCSSMTMTSSRTLARSNGSFGSSGFWGKASSRYSVITSDSTSRRPSPSSRNGTLPMGERARKSSFCEGMQPASSSKGTPFSRSAMRTLLW